MTVLEKSTRKQLDKAVQAARRVATTGADRALRALSVEQEKKPAHLTAEQSELRRQLRVVCRRLGSWDALVQATAYEQWHRMLFSRFLAENNLLIHPIYHAAVTLEECSELAREKGVDQWEVAAEFAAGMLPGIFQKNDPLLLLKFAPEDRMALQEILSEIPAEALLTQDALGWTYQFWQSEEKKRVNKSEKKIEGADICAVTQLFTEHYMVQFLLQNTLGAWWLHLHPESPLRKDWVYYKDQMQQDFSAFPMTANEIKLLDPACGSGHFLVEAFHMLLAMREEEGEFREEAIRGIIRDNLHGLEIDPRCIQIAGFAIALEAWKSGFPVDLYLPLPNLACTGLPIRAEKSEWLKLAAGDGLLEGELEKYYDLFKNADSLGSLIQIEEGTTLVPADVLMQKLNTALIKEKAIGDPVAEVFGETASGVLKAVGYLRRKDFHIVVTNPPFLGKGNQGDILYKYSENIYSKSKNNLSTCFIERARFFSKLGCYYGLVTPQNWLFLESFKKFRISWLKEQIIPLIARLGPNAFVTPMYEYNMALISICNKFPDDNSNFIGIDVSEKREYTEKIENLKLIDLTIKLNQKSQLKNPDSRFIFENVTNLPLLLNYVETGKGMCSFGTPRFIFNFWEMPRIHNGWKYMQDSPIKGRLDSGSSYIIRWENGKGALYQMMLDYEKQGYTSGAWYAGKQFWGKKGVLVGLMNELPVTQYLGGPFNNTTSVIIPKDLNNLPAIWTFCNSINFHKSIRAIDQKICVTSNTLSKIPFDLTYWQKVAEEQYPNGLPKPYSNDPTQWLFHGHLKPSENPLNVAIARLLGYTWPAETDTNMETSSEAKTWILENEKLHHFSDRDGIVCIPAIRGERPAVDRLRDLLAAAYGTEWSLRKEEELLNQVGYTKNGGMEGFIRDEFFPIHCKLFHQRPFIWHIWDGTKDGFSVLVNYHRFDRKNLEKLIYSYLGAWISHQKEEVRQEKAGAERRLAAAEKLKKNLEKILEGEKPFDIYVRWKPLHKQAIGWDPDLNDGVRMNIRPFVEAGVLRWIPKIKWGKDRGKDPVPNCSGTTDRLNDLHFSLEEKRKAREASK